MSNSFQNILDLFVELNGVAENVCLREGESGRGIFPYDALRRTRIATPKNLFVDCENVCISHDEIYVKNSGRLSSKEKKFIELYYNFAWGGGGNSGSAEFLKYVLELPETVKKQLLVCGFIDRVSLNGSLGENRVLKRFVDERAVSFEGKLVLAPVWDLVNHSSFALPFRINRYGVETPPIEPGFDEILFKYSGKNSPISMWKKYGFACDCIVAYSIPFNIDLEGLALSVRCDGQHCLEKTKFSIDGDILSIKSLPLGCLSIGLPWEYFKLIISSVGLPSDVANRLFSKICELNLKARRNLVDCLQVTGSGTQAQLCKALIYEIKLIEDSSIG